MSGSHDEVFGHVFKLVCLALDCVVALEGRASLNGLVEGIRRESA